MERTTSSSLFGLSFPLQAQQTYFTQSGSNYTYPVNQLPFGGNPSSLDFTGNTIQIAGNDSPGSFSALAGALLTADGLSVAYGGTGAVGNVTLSGAGTKVELVGSTVNRLDVGTWGTGTLTVSAGALLDATVNAGACTSGCYNYIGNGAGSTATLNITGASSEVRTLRLFTVGASSVFTNPPTNFTLGVPGGETNAFVNVLAGGTLRTEGAVVASNNASPNGNGSEKANGTVVVDGPGSQWVVKPNSVDNRAAGLTIGDNVRAEGTVNITSGGKFRIDGTGGPGPNDFLNIASNGGKGALTVSGFGSSVDVVGFNTVINLGRSGATGEGSFSILAGATASTLYTLIGRDGAKGTLLIDGAGSRLDQLGVGTINASNTGGAAFVQIGRGSVGSRGEATVSNGGVWVISDGGGDSRPSGGGNPGIDVGRDTGNTGKLTITGTGSKLEIVSTSMLPGAGFADNINPYMSVGRFAGATGDLTIGAGGKLLLQGNALSTPTFSRGTNLFIGGDNDTGLGGNGTVKVSGQGSEIRVTGADGFIAVGRNGTGTLELTNQALVETMIMNVGRAANGNGTLTMNNSTLLLNGQQTGSVEQFGAGLTLGNRGGTGSATITNGSLVAITNLGSSGASLNLGGTGPNPGGDGTLTLNGGSKINFVTAAGLAAMSVGRDGTGIATISGIGSQIDLGTGTVNVAQLAAGAGTLSINGGGKILAGIANIGGSSDTAAGGSGAATVSGLGSELKASGASALITVGRGGVGSLSVTNQGQVTGTILAIGRSGGTGTLTVNNATVELSGQQTTGNLSGARFNVGIGGGTGVASITNGSTLNVTNLGSDGAGVNIGGSGSGNFPLGTGTLSLTGASQLNVTAATGAQANVNIGRDGTGTASLSGGSSINVGTGNLYVARETGSTGTLVMSSGSVINAGFVGVGVSQAGTTSTTLGTPGGTGTLVLNDSTINTSRFELGVGSLLTGNNGVINAGPNGPVIIGGTVSPGNSPGRLRFNCDVTMLFGSKLILEIDQNGASFDIDQLVIGNESVFDLMSLQIVFSFIGDTDPNAFAATPGGFDLNKFLKAGNGDNETAGLQSLFEKNGLANWDAVLNSEMFAFQSTAFDVSGMSFDADTGEVSVSASAIPEPASVALVLLGLLVMVGLSRRRAARRV